MTTPATGTGKRRSGISEAGYSIRMKKVVFGIIVLAQMCALGEWAGLAEAQQGATDGEWRSYGGDTGSTKYSPLDQIDANNFEQLEVAWRWQSVDAFPSTTTGGGGEWRSTLANVVVPSS